MAAIKVYGAAYSTAAMRVLATLHEKDLDYELLHVNLLSGQHKKEPYVLSHNPFGQVPAFEDGDLKLFESRAITRYISQQYADRGTPQEFADPKKQAVSNLWIEVEAHHFDPTAQELNYELSVKPKIGLKTNQAMVAEYEPKFEKVLDVYEARLSQFKYLGGDSFTLADLHHLPTVQYLLHTSAKRLFESLPRVNAWVADVTSRPSWTKVVELRNQAL